MEQFHRVSGALSLASLLVIVGCSKKEAPKPLMTPVEISQKMVSGGMFEKCETERAKDPKNPEPIEPMEKTNCKIVYAGKVMASSQIATFDRLENAEKWTEFQKGILKMGNESLQKEFGKNAKLMKFQVFKSKSGKTVALILHGEQVDTSNIQDRFYKIQSYLSDAL